MAVLKYYNTTTSAWEYIAASTTANFTSWKKTMAGGETSVSGTDDNAVTLSYTVGLEQVFINGVLQVRGSDYTATDGTSVTGLSALVASDIVTVVCYAPFNIANTIAPTVVDAKGDLLVGTGADAVGRLAVGTDGQLLSAASGETSGLKWANGGLTLIKTETFSAVGSVNISNFTSSTYTHYKVVLHAAGSTNVGILFKFRENVTDKSTNYYGAHWRYTYAGVSAVVDTRDNGTDAVIVSTKSGGQSTAEFLFSVLDAGATGIIAGYAYDDFVVAGRSFAYKCGATNITGFSLITSTGTITGNVSIYGYNK
jgi:hypothetical protein